MSRHRGSAKTWALIALIVLLALAVPAGLYYVSTISFSNGTTGANLSAPNTGQGGNVAQGQNLAATNTTPATSARPAQPESPSTGKVLDLLVVDGQTKKPIEGIRVQNTLQNHYLGYTDANGHAPVPVPLDLQNSGYFAVRVGGKGYVPKRLSWAPYGPQSNAGGIPVSYTLSMERPTKIHGKIVDDAGQPVAAAKILIQFTKRFDNPREEVEVNSATIARPILSGADGTWTYAGAPANADQISITAWDNNHVSEDRLDPEPFTPISSLYDGTATYVLQRGVKLTGTVVDAQGAPIGGATVTRGSIPRLYFVVPPQTTDSSGHFTYHYAPGQQVILTFQAKGCAPQMKQLTMGSADQNLTIQMEKAHRITGKVVDSAGKPVPDARISVESWQNASTLKVDFTTDDAGDFHWNDAPADPVTVSVSAPTVPQMDTQTLTPDQNNLIRLGRLTRIHGTVLDAQTGQPIQAFKLTMAIQWPGQDQLNWQGGWDPGWQIRPGGFDIPMSWNYPGVAMRATALGYLPVVSRVVHQDEGDVNLELKMKPGKNLVFTVLNSDGTPLADAQAVMAEPGLQAQINDGKVVSFRGQTATSDQNGKIDLPPPAGAFKIAVVADAGFAEFDQDALAKSEQIKLEPWASIKGRAMIGSKPAANEWVDMSRTDDDGPFFDPQKPRLFNGSDVRTDADGNFQADRIAPGKWSLGRRVQLSNNSWTSASMITEEVQPGQTLTVKIGGTGRPVVGKVILPPRLAGGMDWQYGFCQIMTRNTINEMQPPIPPAIRNGSQQAIQKWFQTWRNTDEGRKYTAAIQKQQEKMRSYPFAISSNGTFRAEDIPPGEYTVDINLQGQRNGWGNADFTMPEGGKIDDPLDIGTVPVTTMDKYRTGDPVYDLPLKMTDGKSARLSDFRGKYLLVDIVRQPNMASAPFAAIDADYGKDSRLAMLTILPPGFVNETTPAKMDKNPGLHAAVVPGNGSLIILNNNFDGGVWLIGPDQKVVAADLPADGIRAALAAALGAPRPGLQGTQPSTAP